MFQFEDEKINEYLKNSESFKIFNTNIIPKDKKDLLVRAFKVDKTSLSAIKKKPNEKVKLINGNSITLELESYITSNGKSFENDKFNSIYKPAGELVKNFLTRKQESLNNIEDILDRIHNKNKPNNKPKISI